MEKLEKERALTHELTSAKSDGESLVQMLRQQLQEQEATLGSLQVQNESLDEEVAGLTKANQKLGKREEELRAKLEREVAEQNQLRDVQVDLMTQIGEKNEEIERTAFKMNEISEQFAEEAKKFHAERDQLLLELSIAQQNIAELVGSRKEGVAMDLLAKQEPPTLPATQISMVDKSAYEALQQAYENIEEMFHKSTDDSKELRSRLHTSHMKNAEFAQRVEKCRVEYENKCKELHELHASREVAVLQAKLQDMEDNQEQVMCSLENATQELSSRKEEIKMKNIKIAEMDEKIAEMEEMLKLVQEEYTKFQDKHDKVLHDKIAKLDEKESSLIAKHVEITELNSTMSALAKDKAKLEHTVQQLREQLEALKLQARSSDRSCPVCATKFPARISQEDFEKHVQGHFNPYNQ